MDLKLIDKTALVTGATAGIGLEIARRLATEGTKVIICGRSQPKLDAAVANLDSKVRVVLADPATGGSSRSAGLACRGIISPECSRAIGGASSSSRANLV